MLKINKKVIFRKLSRILLRILIIIFILYLFYFIVFVCNDGYLSGRDTVESYVNGRFQIIRSNTDAKLLSDEKEEKILIPHIKRYYEDEDNVYIIGDDEYLILNLKKKDYKMSKNLDDFTIEEQRMFISF